MKLEGNNEVTEDIEMNENEVKTAETAEETTVKEAAETEETSETEQEEKEDRRMRYDQSGLDERIIHAVSEMGFEYMSPIQEAAIPVMMEGKDIIGQAQTGTGKTAAFGIPLLQKVDSTDKHLQAIVLCPTRELAMQAADDIRDFAKYMPGVKVLAVYGGQDISRQIRALSAGVQIVVGTPGRVMDHMRRHTLKTQDVKVLVLDEADEMLDMGFREDIETILKEMPQERQTALFSATMPKPILDITNQYQHDAKYIRMTPKEITVSAIEQAYYRIPHKDKEEVLARLLDFYQPHRALIFCNTKRMVDQLSESLKNRGYQAEGLHGDLSQNQRDTVMNLFRSGRISLLLATDVAARGIDVSNVDCVFNFDIPEDIEYYVHRIGRTGRAGKSGKSFTLVSGREMYKLRDIEKICHTKIEERQVPTAKEITKAKSTKVFAEVIDIIENGDIDSTLEFVQKKVEEGEYTAEQLAAGFMRLKMGKDIEDLKIEREAGGRGGRNGDRGGRSEGGRGRGRDFGRGRSEGGRGGRYEGKSEGGRGGRYEGKSEGGRGGRYGDKSEGGRGGRYEGKSEGSRGSRYGRPEGDRFARKDKDKNGKSVHFSEVSEKMLSGLTKKPHTRKPADSRDFGEKKTRSYGESEHKAERFYGKDERGGRSFEGKSDKKKRTGRMPQSSFSTPSDRVSIKTRGTDGKFYE